MDTDFDLLTGLRSGDEQAFAALVERYHNRLIRLAMTFVDRRESAEDVAQETWMAVIRGIDRFEGRSALQAWLFQICVNRARSLAVREQRQAPLGDDRGDVFDRVDLPEEPENLQATAELAQLAQLAIDQLPAMQRQVVTLRDVEGRSSEETCRITGLTAGNQRVTLHRGRAAIRRLWAATSARPRDERPATSWPPVPVSGHGL